jgi:hypothetical protein
MSLALIPEVDILLKITFDLRRQVAVNLCCMCLLLQHCGVMCTPEEIDTVISNVMRDMEPEELATLTAKDFIAGLKKEKPISGPLYRVQ